MKKGFTLIELLIVVAIIGILAAIAVPNFLNAQIRAKIARCYSDMKSISTAVSMLQLDRNHLPIDAWDDDTAKGREILRDVFNNVGNVAGNARGARDFLAVLTSPISYMSSVPDDPFLSKLVGSDMRGFGSPLDTYVYTDVDPVIYAAENSWNQGIQALNSKNRNGFAENFGIPPLKMGEFGIIAVGPDGVAGIPAGGGSMAINQSRGFPYSPSNGTVSHGDIVMTSAGIIGQN